MNPLQEHAVDPGRAAKTAAFALTLPGLAAVLLPFAYEISPLSALRAWENLSLIGAPFFLAIPIAYGQARKLFGSRPGSLEIAAAYLFSSAALISAIWFTALVLVHDGLKVFQDSFGQGILACWVLSATSIAILWLTRMRRVAADATAEVFLLSSYLPNAALCLIWLRLDKNLQSGAWASLFACIAYGALIAWILRNNRESAHALRA